jgi:hypothetical protein
MNNLSNKLKQIEEEFDKLWTFSGEKDTFWVVGERKPEKIKSFYRTAISTLLQQVGEEVNQMEKLPYHACIAQNRNGMDYCSTCEQAWEDCSCSARNTGYKKAIEDVRSRLDSVISSLK